MVDLLFLAHNRLDFTRASFTAMVRNTDWSKVDCLHVYDDDSEDGTTEYLKQATREVLTKTVFVEGLWGSSVTPLAEFIQNSTAEIIGKIDNDTMLPPGWLGRCLDVMDAAPELDLLGIEAFTDPGDPEGYRPALHIGGIGLFRRRAFQTLPHRDGRFQGFTAWQVHNKSVIKGWIQPALQVFLLDHLPMEPWKRLAYEYGLKGWQRPWTKYTDEQSWMWQWWT